MSGRILSPIDSQRLSLMTPKEREAVICTIINQLRAKQSQTISRMRKLPKR